MTIIRHNDGCLYTHRLILYEILYDEKISKDSLILIHECFDLDVLESKMDREFTASKGQRLFAIYDCVEKRIIRSSSAQWNSENLK